MKSILLFDGVCNLCNGFVKFIIVRDKNHIFNFASLQSEKAKEILKPQGISVDEIKTVILIEEGKIFKKSDAALRVVSQLPYWKWVKIVMIIPRFMRDAVYDLVARYRYRIFGKKDYCMIPLPGWKDRFID